MHLSQIPMGHTLSTTRKASAGAPAVRAGGAIPAQKPHYDGGSIVNLMASIVEASGGEPRYAGLDGLGRDELCAARHIVLVVVDGLGFEFLRASHAGRALRRQLRQRMTTVYPPTTATAITTFLTGLAPQQHGLTGWFMYFKELGGVVSVLPFTTRLGGMRLSSAGVTAQGLLGHTSVFDTIARAGVCVSPRDIVDSDFNRAHTGRAALYAYGTLDDLVQSTSGAVRRAREPSFLYAYWPQLDRIAHEHGIGSRAVQAHLAQLDAAYERLLHELEGTDSLVLLTADHGFVDVEPESIVHVAEHPVLRDALQAPLCGEPRTAYCYVSPRHRRRFADYVGSELADAAACIESAALVDEGYFGPGPAHPQLLNRVGDYTLVMRAGRAIHDSIMGEERFAPRGMHGGGSTAEVCVPLVVAQT